MFKILLAPDSGAAGGASAIGDKGSPYGKRGLKTKDESQSARRDLIALIRNEIYRQSFVPDMTDPALLGQKSGEAFQYLFALFELMAAEKESYFTQGFREQLKLARQQRHFQAIR